MRVVTRTRYVVDGAEFGLSGVEPLETEDLETAMSAQRVLTAARADGRLALVTSRLRNWGRNGIQYPAFAWAKGAHGEREADSVEKVVLRCRELVWPMRQEWRDLPVALRYAREGRVEELGCWSLRFECIGQPYGGASAMLAAPDEETAVRIMEAWLPSYRRRGDGLYEMSGRGYRLSIDCLQRPRQPKAPRAGLRIGGSQLVFEL